MSTPKYSSSTPTPYKRKRRRASAAQNFHAHAGRGPTPGVGLSSSLNIIVVIVSHLSGLGTWHLRSFDLCLRRMAEDKVVEGEAVAEPMHEYVLGRDEELRFEVPEGKHHITVTMTDGMGEVFGTEMVKNKPYRFFPNWKQAIFTYHGCTLQIKGKTESAYIAKETPMMTYLNAHASLETLRRSADTDGKRGPIVLVVGPTDVGKSTLCRILLNYAVRLGRRPIYVDLDVGQGAISVPGTIGSVMIERQAGIEEDGFTEQAPLSYFFGANTPSANIPLYNTIISKLAEVIHERTESNRKVKSSGVIINTCGWVKADGYRSITHIAQAFEVDVILVLDQERLYNELSRDMPSFVRVVFLAKSGGVVDRNSTFRASARDARIHEYFYGKPGIQKFHPHSFQVKLADAEIFKIGGPPVAESLLPLGMKPEDTRLKLMPVTPTAAALVHRLLAISFAANSASEDVIKKNIVGYVCVTDVDVEKGRMTVLSPQPGPLPKLLLLLSDIQFMDSN